MPKYLRKCLQNPIGPCQNPQLISAWFHSDFPLVLTDISLKDAQEHAGILPLVVQI